MNDVLIFLSFAAFVLSPCFIALRSREQREEARLGPRLVPAREPRPSSGVRRKLIVDQLPSQNRMQRQVARREMPREAFQPATPRHTGLRSPYGPSASQGAARRKKDASVFIPPTRQIPTLGYTSSPVPALIYGLPQSSPDDLVCLFVLPGGRAQQRPLPSF